MAEPPKRRLSKLFVVGLALSGIAAYAGLGYMVTTAIDMVRAGRGLETYRTFWLVEFNWISFLVLIAGVVVAFVVALVFQLREHLLWRSLERKYGGRDENR
jgi:hypothetical protein